MGEGGKIRVVVVGAAGKMGQEVMRALSSDPDFELVGAVDRSHAGETTRDVAGQGVTELTIQSRLGEVLDAVRPDVLVDFTHGAAAPDHAISAVKRGIAAVVGSSGVAPADLSAVRQQCEESGAPCLVVPNFAIGAVLLMQFAEQAARWLPDCEVIEMHRTEKLDAPSGTAFATAQRISEARGQEPRGNPQATEGVAGVRGGKVKGVPVHSIRLPGLVAHQEVLFSGEGELLTVRHDSLDRRSFMAGVKLACRGVRGLSGLVVGLERVMSRRPEEP